MSELHPCAMCGAPWAQMCQEKDERIAELERELAMNGAQMAGDSALIRGLKQENARLRDICQVTRIMLRNVLRERDFGWCMGEVTEIVKRLDAVTALESSDE